MANGSENLSSIWEDFIKKGIEGIEGRQKRDGIVL